jgi:hypothetical protein
VFRGRKATTRALSSPDADPPLPPLRAPATAATAWLSVEGSFSSTASAPLTMSRHRFLVGSRELVVL